MTAATGAPDPSPAPQPASPIDWQALATNRTAQDRLLERVRLRLAGTDYVLPVLKSGPNQRWLEALDRDTRALLGQLQADGTDGPQIVGMFLSPVIMPAVKAHLYAYDTTHVLPPQAVLDEQITDMGYVRALLEVWAAAHPLVGTALETVAAILTVGSSQPTSTLPPPTAGRRRGSRRN